MAGSLVHFGSILAVLVALALASPRRGWRLALVLAAFTWLVGSLNLMIEAAAFGVLPWRQAVRFSLLAAPVFALLAVVATLLAWQAPRPRPGPPPRLTPLRVASVVLAYEALYLSAGMAVFPYVAHFYYERHLPPLWMTIALQVPRALIFLAAAYPLLRLQPRVAAPLMGLAFSVIGGLAPLAVENPLMPPDVRAAHAVEVGISNFLFGLALVALLQWRRRT